MMGTVRSKKAQACTEEMRVLHISVHLVDVSKSQPPFS